MAEGRSGGAAFSPLVVCEGCAALAPRLFGSVGWYAALARYPSAGMDFGMRYDKRMKSTHRFTIADHGLLRDLTVPVSRPEGGFISGNLTWGDILVSAHGRWWETMPIALETAYGRTPFFQYYAPKLEHLFREPAPGALLADFLRAADGAVRAILGLPAAPEAPLAADCADLRSIPADAPGPREYWQVQAPPFIAGLSVLDLIFNQGPEAPLYLRP
ncbi:MAG: WbqC family protein [Muribaculaceae bacterium]|nr:WbqC family protein [Muribaculaceae bacterium]